MTGTGTGTGTGTMTGTGTGTGTMTGTGTGTMTGTGTGTGGTITGQSSGRFLEHLGLYYIGLGTRHDLHLYKNRYSDWHRYQVNLRVFLKTVLRNVC